MTKKRQVDAGPEASNLTIYELRGCIDWQEKDYFVRSLGFVFKSLFCTERKSTETKWPRSFVLHTLG